MGKHNAPKGTSAAIADKAKRKAPDRGQAGQRARHGQDHPRHDRGCPRARQRRHRGSL